MKDVSKIGDIYKLNNLRNCKRITEKQSIPSIDEDSNPIVYSPEVSQGKLPSYEVLTLLFRLICGH